MMTNDQIRDITNELRTRDEAIAALTIERDDAQARVRELETERAGVAYFACWPEGMLEAMGFTDVSSVAEVTERIKVLTDCEARVRELEAMTSTATILAVHKALGAAPGESVMTRAEKVMEKLQRPGNLGEILGWVGDESLVSAAVRVVGERDSARRERDEAKAARGWLADPTQQTVLDILGIAAGDRTDPIGRIKALVEMEKSLAKMDASPVVTASAVQILRDALLLDGDDDIDDLAKMAADQITAIRDALKWQGEGSCGTLVEHARDVRALLDEAPVQTFRPPISVTVHHVTGHAFAEVEIGDITDPVFLALPMGARLGLVVLRG